MKVVLLLLALLALAQLGSCTSPLELETTRIDSVVTPSVKLRSLSTTIWGGAPSGAHDTLIDFWAPVQDTVYFRLNDGSSPPRFSFHTVLSNDTTVATSSPLKLDRLTIDMTNISANGTMALGGSAGGAEGRSVHATGRIDGREFHTDSQSSNFTAMAQMTYTETPAKRLEGRITILIEVSAILRLRIVTEIVGEA